MKGNCVLKHNALYPQGKGKADLFSINCLKFRLPLNNIIVKTMPYFKVSIVLVVVVLELNTTIQELTYFLETIRRRFNYCFYNKSFNSRL